MLLHQKAESEEEVVNLPPGGPFQISASCEPGVVVH